MPTYQAQCSECDCQHEYISSVARCLDVPDCPLCGKTSRKVILSAPLGYVTGKFEAFVSMVDGSVVRNDRELKEHNKRNNVVNLQEGFSEEKVLKGDFGQQGTKKVDKKELVKDILEAKHKVEQGYKPTKEVHEDE